jgi:pyruvate dehydrogenase E2 component (dihydrolipoamide acetyltransferase)
MARREFLLPDLGEGLEEAEIGEWRVAEGDRVELNQPLVEVETAKATVEIPSPFAGVVAVIHAATGTTLAVGAPLVTFEVEDAGLAAGAGPAPVRSEGIPASTPAVRKVAKERGVDLAAVRGTGPGGRVTREDVERAASMPSVEREPSAAPKEPDEAERVPISPIRRAIAENLTRTVREVPQVTAFRTLDCTALEAFRAELGTSPLPIVVRALAEICSAHPQLNASYRAEEGVILVHRRVHIGVATDTDRGLVVPVVRDAGALGIAEVAEEIGRLARAAREGSLTPADMHGGTITVTNTGSYGSEAGTPIINPPEAAILALGVIEPRALVVDGRVEARPACTLSLTFDHRALDGATAGRAFGGLVALLEDAGRLRALPR